MEKCFGCFCFDFLISGNAFERALFTEDFRTLSFRIVGTTREDPIYFDSAVDVKSTRMLQGEGRRNAKYINFFTWTQLEEPILLPFSSFTMEITNGKILYNQTFVSIFLSSSRRRKNREEQRREEQRDVEIKVWKYSTLLLRLIKHCDSNFSRNRRMDDEPEIERKVFEGSLDRR